MAAIISNWIEWNEYLEGAHFLILGCPVSLLDLCGSILVCLRYRTTTPSSTRRSWLESLISCALMQFGGTTLTGILLGQTPSWIISHSAIPALLLAWWLTFYCPYDVYFSIVNMPISQTALLPGITVMSAISSGHAVTSWGSDKALFNAFHTNAPRIALSIFTVILAGTFSGCGGGLLADCMCLLKSPSYVWQRPSWLEDSPSGYAAARVPTKSLCLACLYYCLLHPLRLPLISPYKAFSKQEGHLAITVLQVISAVVTMMHGADGTYTSLARAARRVLLIGDIACSENSSEQQDTRAYVADAAALGRSGGDKKRAPSVGRRQRGK